MTNKDERAKSKAHAESATGKTAAKDPKREAKQQPSPGHQVPHGSGEGASGMQPGAGHPRGR